MEDVQLAGLRLGGAAVLRLRLFRAAVRVGRAADPSGQGIRVTTLTADEIREYRGTLDRAGQGQPVPRPLGRGEPRPVPSACGPGSSPTGRGRCGRRSTWLAQPEHARSGDVPHPARRASSHGRQVVHLSHVRLCARPVGLHRGSHALAVHAGVRDHRPLYDWFLEQLGIFHAAADRVRPPQPDLHGDEQAQAAGAGGDRARARLGRSAHADARRAAPARLHARGDPRFRARASACRKTNGIVDLALLEHCVREDLNKRAPRVMAVLSPLKSRDRQLSRGPGRGDGGGEQPRGRERGHAQGAVLPRTLHRAGRLPRSASAENISASRRAARCGCATATSSPAKSVVKNETGEVVEVHCTYDPATRGGNAPDGRKVKATIHWVSARARGRCRSAPLRKPVHQRESRRSERGRGCARLSQSELAGDNSACEAGAIAGQGRAGRPVSVRTPGLLLRRSGFEARRAGVQPHRSVERHVGKGGEEARKG